MRFAAWPPMNGDHSSKGIVGIKIVHYEYYTCVFYQACPSVYYESITYVFFTFVFIFSQRDEGSVDPRCCYCMDVFPWDLMFLPRFSEPGTFSCQTFQQEYLRDVVKTSPLCLLCYNMMLLVHGLLFPLSCYIFLEVELYLHFEITVNMTIVQFYCHCFWWWVC